MASSRIYQLFRNMNTLAHRGLSIGTINSSTIIATRHISLISATNLSNGWSNGMVIPASLTKMVPQKKPSLIQQQRRTFFNESTLTKQQDMNQMQRRPYAYNANNETHKKIHDLVTKNKSKGVFVFMKGVPSAPSCGYSDAVCQILKAYEVEFDSYDVLSDDVLRREVKSYSDWPTIPQVYINGTFVGGCDTLLQMHQSGELEQMFKKINK